MICIFFIHRWEVLLAYLVILPVLFRMAKLSISLVLNNLRAFWGLFLLTLILHGLFTPGRILWKLPLVSIYITEDGLYQGFFYALRIGILIILANLLTLTTSPMSLTDAIERFLAPFRRLGVPAHEIGMMLSISLRFIPILLDESERIRRAQVSRGARFEGNVFHRIRSIVPLIIPLFLSAFRRAHELALAMDARCYNGGEKRTNYYILSFRRIDALALLAVLLIGIPTIALGNR